MGSLTITGVTTRLDRLRPVRRLIASFAVATLLVACASTPKVAVSPTSAPPQEKLEADTKECLEIAKTYDLGKEKKKSPPATKAIRNVLKNASEPSED